MHTSSHTTGPGGHQTFTVGDIAKKTGLSVRTLHHYEEVGILVPSERGDNGYRLYSETDLSKLLQIVSLKQLGFSLAEVASTLEKKSLSPEQILEKNLASLSQEMQSAAEAKDRMNGMLRLLRARKPVSSEEFLKLIELMHRVQEYFTPEDHEVLKKRREELGDEKIIAVENRWPTLIAEMQAQMDKGTDPADPVVQKLTAEWMALVSQFTGGDPKMAAKLKKMYDENPDASKQFGGPDPKMFAYVNEAMEIAKKNGK